MTEIERDKPIGNWEAFMIGVLIFAILLGLGLEFVARE
jgi:hypothetical protein